jgi:bifunctional DNA-binding transcriptional regulator/antitoxin component of YhaV-PrlF toxin-antitoxin module
MNMHAKLSSKGHVLIPKAMRDGMNIPDNADFELVRQADNILLRRSFAKQGRKLDQVLADLATISAPYRPEIALPVEQISSISDDDLRTFYDANPV